jgi:hypothetical protein
MDISHSVGLVSWHGSGRRDTAGGKNRNEDTNRGSRTGSHDEAIWDNKRAKKLDAG